MSIDQNDLAQRLRAGDETILKELETDVWPVVRCRVLRRFGGLLHADDMSDILAESLLTVWRDRGSFDESKGSVPAWFTGIAFNKARELAKNGWFQQRQREWGIDLVQLVVAERAVDEDDDGDSQPCPMHRDVLLLRECLAGMSPRRRDILLACRACDGAPPTSRELAAEFGISPELVRQELHRAEAELRGFFQKAKAEGRCDDKGGGR